MPRIRTLAFALLAILLTLVALPADAPAQSEKGKKDIQGRTKKAMENFDMLEFEAAKSGLEEALGAAKKAGLADDPVTARVHLYIGIVEFAGLKDEGAAREAFAAAVAIDPKVQIDVAYKTDGMAELLDSVRKGAGGGAKGKGKGKTEEDDLGLDLGVGTGDDQVQSGDMSGVECGELDGIDHELVDQGKPGEDVEILARVGDAVGASKVSLFYRAAGASKFTEVPMERGDGCSYEGAIPKSATKGESVHYYVAALDGKTSLASRGTASSPNIVELGGGGSGGGAGDGDNPLGGSVSTSVTDDGAPKKKTVFLSVALGTGGGYVTGQTEVAQSDVSCCFAQSMFHIFPEIGYYFSRRMSVSVAFRMGFAVGANIKGHASAAPAGLLRMRYSLAESGEGLQVSGAVGGGIIRNTIKVQEAADGMDIDTTASGPFLIGGGIGYLKAMSRALNLVAELNGILGIKGGVEELGPCPNSGCVRPNNGMQFDLNLGLLLAF
ncbi:MAG TPA: hypothetical protein VMZ28_08140 [Kofleriaceae bacterium]|nr:hypothetical protein [Kofleriaceae bacterium]